MTMMVRRNLDAVIIYLVMFVAVFGLVWSMDRYW